MYLQIYITLCIKEFFNKKKNKYLSVYKIHLQLLKIHSFKINCRNFERKKKKKSFDHSSFQILIPHNKRSPTCTTCSTRFLFFPLLYPAT